MAMDFLQGLVDARPANSKRPGLLPCDEATLILERIRQGRGRKGQHFVFEFCVESARGPGADRPGARVAEVFNLDGNADKDDTKRSLIRSVLDALQLEPSDFQRVFADAEEKDPSGEPRKDGGYLCRGFRVRVSAAKDTRPPKDPSREPFLLKVWMQAPPHTPEAIAEAKRVLDGLA